MQPTAQNEPSPTLANKSAQLAADAKRLGCHRTTLWRALEGKTGNAKLVARYNELVSVRTKTQTPTP